ncbi:hypothetical protein J6590_101101, partial [Homalodisca vitripennis]
GRRPLGARGKEITSPVTSRDPSVTHPGKDQDVSCPALDSLSHHSALFTRK